MRNENQRAERKPQRQHKHSSHKNPGGGEELMCLRLTNHFSGQKSEDELSPDYSIYNGLKRQILKHLYLFL